MPNITVELLRGRSVDQRKAFVAAVTEAAISTLGARKGDVRIVFHEITADIVANGGVLASEDAGRAGLIAGLDTPGATAPTER